MRFSDVCLCSFRCSTADSSGDPCHSKVCEACLECGARDCFLSSPPRGSAALVPLRCASGTLRHSRLRFALGTSLPNIRQPFTSLDEGLRLRSQCRDLLTWLATEGVFSAKRRPCPAKQMAGPWPGKPRLTDGNRSPRWRVETLPRQIDGGRSPRLTRDFACNVSTMSLGSSLLFALRLWYNLGRVA